jgi:hypothetical protein
MFRSEHSTEIWQRLQGPRSCNQEGEERAARRPDAAAHSARMVSCRVRAPWASLTADDNPTADLVLCAKLLYVCW